MLRIIELVSALYVIARAKNDRAIFFKVHCMVIQWCTVMRRNVSLFISQETFCLFIELSAKIFTIYKQHFVITFFASLLIKIQKCG